MWVVLLRSMRCFGWVLVFLLSCFGVGFGCDSGDSDAVEGQPESAASSGGAPGGGAAGEASTADGGNTSSTGSGAGGTGGDSQGYEPSPGDGQSGGVSGGVTASTPQSASSDSASLRVSATIIDFYGIYQQYLPPDFLLQVDFEGDGVVIGHPPEVDHAEWLSVQQEDDEDTTSPVDIRFEMSSFGYDQLAPGDYETTIRVATGRLEGNSFIDEDSIAYVDIQVRLHLVDRVTARPEAPVAYARQGQPRAPGPSISLGGPELGGPELDWSARSSVSWLSFTPAEGTTPATVRTWIDASELDVGEHSAQIFIEEPDSEYRAVVELTLHVDARRMMVSHTGVAFSAYPTAASRLSTSVAVVDSAGLGLEWSASSNQDWLLAEPSDTAPSELELSADPAGLEPGKVHFGEVVVASDEPGVEDTERIRVGLFVASADPPEVWDFELEVFEGGDSLKYVIDPVRPYVYLTSMDDAIRRFPLHPDLDDGQPTVFGDLGEQLGDLTISDDGSKLFVADVGSEQLLVLPLPDPDEPLQIWDGGWSRPTFVRTFGQELVFGDDNVAREAATGNPVLEDAYDDPSGENPVLFSPTRHGHLIFASDQVVVGSSGARSFHEYAFGYSELEGRAWFTLLDVLGDGAIREILTNDRGDWVAAGDALYERQGDVLVELRSLGAGGCLRDVTPAGAWTHCSPTDLVRLYDPGGVKLAQYTVRTGRPAVARVSGDGTQLALLLRDSPDHHLSVMRLDRPDAE